MVAPIKSTLGQNLGDDKTFYAMMPDGWMGFGKVSRQVSISTVVSVIPHILGVG